MSHRLADFRATFLFFALTLFILAVSTASSAPVDPAPMPAATSQEGRAVATFECIGLYWSPANGATDNVCSVRYRPAGNSEWKEAMPLWFDERNREYRGSIVGLKPGTEYEVALKLDKEGDGKKEPLQLKVKTWSESFPIKKTITLPTEVKTFAITESGDESGYVLYTAGPKGTVIDADGKEDVCLKVTASKVIIRGLTLKNPKWHAMRLLGPVHDVVIEQCDISGWGRIAADGFGSNMDSGICGDSTEDERIIIQRNKIHHPRSDANDWSQPRPLTGERFSSHPSGPQAISFSNPRGNFVIRYNEIYSDEKHRFNDAIGGGSNFSFEGFPGKDSDIYGNYISNVSDDSIEAEGGGCNVRLWGNYMEYAYSGVATTAVAVGPTYIFRNVMGLSRAHPSGSMNDTDNRGFFAKIGNDQTQGKMYGNGRRYLFHNTTLQPTQDGITNTMGVTWGACDVAGPMTNTVTRNNIFDVCTGFVMVHFKSPGGFSVSDGKSSPTNDLDYDLCTGEIRAAEGNEKHAVKIKPVYAPGNGPISGREGKYELAAGSPGVDAGLVIPNFNDGFTGKAPDMGAVEIGSAPMQFGVSAGK